jgi:hypothetical protein
MHTMGERRLRLRALHRPWLLGAVFACASLLALSSNAHAQEWAIKDYPVTEIPIDIGELTGYPWSQNSPVVITVDGFAAGAAPRLRIVEMITESVAWSANPQANAQSVSITVPAGQIRDYHNLHILAGTSGIAGTARVSVNGTVLLEGHQYKPNWRRVPRGQDLSPAGSVVYETSLTTSEDRFSMFALDCNFNDVAFNDGGGVWINSRIEGSNICYVLPVGWPGANPNMPVNIYSNDVERDQDGDGLGKGLEAALGICDVLGGAGCRKSDGVYNARDTDRDGLDDKLELFGAEAGSFANVLHMSMWGASPAHKDLFVEVDRLSRLGSGMSADDLKQVAAFYADGSANELKNPDGQPGINVHFDVGFGPTAGTGETVYGDWNGSNGLDFAFLDTLEVLDSNGDPVAVTGSFTASAGGCAVANDKGNCYALKARHHILNENRRAVFLYMTRLGGDPCAVDADCDDGQCFLGACQDSGGGQWTSAANAIKYASPDPRLIAHEMGHALGLQHHGHDSWGGGACKPNYVSLMNYTYMDVAGVGFSHGGLPVLYNPEAHETFGIGGNVDQTEDLGNAFGIPVNGTSVDWNFSGGYSDAVRRMTMIWSPQRSRGGCSAMTSGLVRPSEDLDLANITPALSIWPEVGQLQVFWVDSNDDKIHFATNLLSNDTANGNCAPGGPDDEYCGAWDVNEASYGDDVESIATAQWTHTDPSGTYPATLLAYVDDSNQVKTVGLRYGGDSPVKLVERDVPGSNTTMAPAVTYESVLQSFVAMWVDATTSEYMVSYASATEDGYSEWSEPVPAADATGASLLAAYADAGVIATQPPALTALPEGTICGAFTGGDKGLRLACTDPWSLVQWWEVDTEVVHENTSAPGIAFELNRGCEGTPEQCRNKSGEGANPSQGRFWITFRNGGEPLVTHSDITSDFDLSLTLDAALKRMGCFGSLWTKAKGSTGITLASSPFVSSMKGARINNKGKLEVYPFADGTRARAVRGGNDFWVMERGLCHLTRRSVDDAVDYCGDEYTHAVEEGT